MNATVTRRCCDALPREDFAWMVVQAACETEPADEDDPECIRILRRDLKSAVLAALLRHDAEAARAAIASTAQRDPLRDFARAVMQAWPEGGIDGGHLQEIALAHGLLRPAEPPTDWDGCNFYERTELIK